MKFWKCLSVIMAIVIVVLSCLVGNLYLKEDNQNHKIYKSYAGDTSTQSNSGVAYMVETGVGTGIYEQASDSTWPTGDGIAYNSTKSACEKGSTLSYDDSTHKLTINSTKTDKCFIYFNKFILPVVTMVSNVCFQSGGLTLVITATTGTNPISNYYFSIDDGATYKSSSTNTYNFNGLTDGTTYYVRVYVVDAKGFKSNIYNTTMKPTSW